MGPTARLFCYGVPALGGIAWQRRGPPMEIMTRASRIGEIVEPTLEAMGYDLVRARLTGNQRPVLQIMAERKDGAGMTVDDCAEISRSVSVLLDVENPISGAYTLEVSSPGIDRPLVRHRDFERFAGFEARIELRGLLDGRRRFRGKLLGITADGVRIETAEGEVELPFEEIGNAKLVLTDELIAASTQQDRT